MPDAREAELRDRVRSILAANRELGGRYEEAAVGQIVDLLQGRRPPRPPRAPAPPPAVPAPLRRSRGWSPLVMVALIALAVIVGIPVLRAVAGALAGMVSVFAWVVFGLACAFAVKLFRRMSRAIERPRYDAWEDDRGHRWRRVY